MFNSRFTSAPADKLTVVAYTNLPVELVSVGLATKEFVPPMGDPMIEATWKVCNISSTMVPSQSLTNLWAVLGP
jgi:hypothetical protein